MGATLTIDTQGLLDNLRTVHRLAHDRGVDISVVTKALTGHRDLVELLVNSGATSICESHLENLKKWESLTCEKWLIRSALPGEAEDTVRLADVSLVSESMTLSHLSQQAVRQDRTHKVVIMVELGELREGCLGDELGHLATWCHELPGIELYGIGANLSCLHDIVPDVVNMNLLATYAESIETHLGISLPVISGGSSSALRMLVDGTLPKRINHLRLGEAILLGNIVCYDEPYPSARQDIFTLSAGIIEVKDKPSLPYGQRAPGRVAVGEDPTLSDQGIRRRALVGIGKQDVRSEYLVALDPQITILGDTSDCLVADVTDCDRDYAVGDRVDFRLKYSGLVTAMASVYVTKELV